jgi:hypothetical protein
LINIPVFYLSAIIDTNGNKTEFKKHWDKSRRIAVVFHNTLLNDASATHPKINPRSLHGGMPVIKGEKWMVNLWFRENLRY